MTDSATNKIQRIKRSLDGNETLSTMTFSPSTNTTTLTSPVAKYTTPVILAQGTPTITDCSAGNSFTLSVTGGGAETLGAPINVTPGMKYTWALTSDASASYAYDASFLFAGGTGGTSAGAATDILTAVAATDGSGDLYASVVQLVVA